jgi:hypothetical protein
MDMLFENKYLFKICFLQLNAESTWELGNKIKK